MGMRRRPRQLEGVAQTKTSIRNNIWKLYAIHAAYSTLFFIPILVPFFQQNGLTLGDVFLLQGVFMLVMMVLEIPSGYLADRWGRKNTTLTGSCFGISGILLYTMCTTFVEFFIAEVLFAILVSFHSGTLDALMYDTLLELQETPSYRKVCGNQRFVGFIAQSAASIGGGILALIALRTTVWATLIPFVIGFFVALTLHEPKRREQREPQRAKPMSGIIADVLIRSLPLRSIIALSGLLSSLTFALVWFTQLYQSVVGLPLWLFGVTHATMMMGAGVTSKVTHKFGKYVGNRRLLVGIAIAIIGSYLVLGFATAPWGIVLLFIGRSMYGFIDPLTMDIVNRMTTSDIRATVLSVRSFGQRATFALASPILGYLINVYTLNQALLLTGIAGGLGLLVIFLMMRKVWVEIPT